MSGRTILIAVAAVAWLLASLLVVMLVAWVGFFAVGFVGLLFWFVCTRIELEKDGAIGSNFSPDLFARQIKMQDGMSRAERAGLRHEQALALQSVRFFKHLGIGLAVIGFGGFLLHDL